MSHGSPLWRQGFDRAERLVGKRLEDLVSTRTFSEALVLTFRGQNAVYHDFSRHTRRSLRFWNMPAHTDISNLRRQVVALSAEVQQLVTNLEQAQAEQHIVVLLDPSLVAAESRDSNDGRAFELPFRSDLDDGIIASRLRALQAELENPGLLGRLYIDSLSCEIATRLIRVHAAGPARRHHGGLSPRRLRQVKDYIAENLADDITLSDIASVAGVSSGHFCRAFRRSTGVRSHFYIVRQRIERAKSLLTANDMPLAQIAVACGFGDQSHFTACFRRAVGTTPGRFRRDA